MDTKLIVDPRIRDGLSHLVRALEVAGGDKFIVSILLVSADGEHLSCFVGPSLPEAFCTAIEGEKIGPSAGSCGTAAYLGHAIYVHDIARDPLWDGYRDLALPYGLRSCWSTPILDGGGEVVATFAIYHRRASSPSTDEVEAIGHAAKALLPLIEAQAKRPRRPRRPAARAPVPEPRAEPESPSRR